MKLISAIIAIIVAVVGSLFIYRKQSDNMIESIRIAYDISSASIPKVDPAEVRSFPQGLLIDNLYSKLVEYDANGNLQAGVASKFYWEENILIFEFKNRAKTISGKFVDEIDAAVSLRRLLKLGNTTHVNLRLFLCEINSVSEVFQDCDAIKTQPGKLIIALKDPSFKPFLLQALASIDFGIVPLSAISKNDLSILNNEQTSGPYYLSEKLDDRWVLKANEHYRITAESPREVVLKSIEKKDTWDLFTDSEVDIVTTDNSLNATTYQKIMTIPNVEISKTLGIKLFFITFSPKAMKDFTAKQRRYIGNQFRKVMQRKYPLPLDSTPTTQFFLDLGFGNLSKPQAEELESLSSENEVEKFDRKLTFYMYNSMLDTFSVFREIPELDPIETEEYPFMQHPKDRLDVFMATTDTDIEESLDFLGYNFTQYTFGMTEEQGAAWTREYMAMREKSDRLSKIQALHFNMLKNAVTIPLFKAPYTAVARNGFVINLSPISASTQFSRISKK